MERKRYILKVQDWFRLSEIDFYINHHTTMKNSYDLDKVRNSSSEQIENFYIAVKSWYEEELKNNLDKIIHNG